MFALNRVFLMAILLAYPALAQIPAEIPDPTVPEAQEPDSEKPSIELIIGQVTDAMGGGHAKVTVELVRLDDKDKEVVVQTTTTNDFGDFSILVDKPLVGKMIVRLSHPDYESKNIEVELTEDDIPFFVFDQLKGKEKLKGRVSHALSQDPVEAATIRVEAGWQNWSATTDENGEFLIEGLPPGRGEIIVEATGFGREKLPVQFGESEKLNVALKPERVVTLTVVNDAEQPVSTAIVETYDEPRQDFQNFATNKEGIVEMRSIHFDATALALRISHPDHVSDTTFERVISLPADTPNSTHEVQLPRAGRIAGVVVDTETGLPVNGARLMAGTSYSEQNPWAWADFEGKFELAGVVPGDVTVTTYSTDHAPALTNLVVEAGQTAELTVKLSRPTPLEGVVLSSDGTPVPHARLVTTRWRDRTTLALQAIADDRGRFILTNAPADTFELAAYGPGGARSSIEVDATAKKPLEIKLPEATSPASREGSLKPGTDAPPFTFTSLDKTTLTLADLKGKFVLLDFWATWCGPCIVEIPNLQAVHKKHGKRSDFVMISVSLDYVEKDLQNFVSSKNMPWHHVFGDQAVKAADLYGVEGIPAMFLIDKEGKIVRGAWDAEPITEAVARLIAGGSEE